MSKRVITFLMTKNGPKLFLYKEHISLTSHHCLRKMGKHKWASVLAMIIKQTNFSKRREEDWGERSDVTTADAEISAGHFAVSSPGDNDLPTCLASALLWLTSDPPPWRCEHVAALITSKTTQLMSSPVGGFVAEDQEVKDPDFGKVRRGWWGVRAAKSLRTGVQT